MTTSLVVVDAGSGLPARQSPESARSTEEQQRHHRWQMGL